MKYLVVLIPQNSNGHLALCTDQRNLELEVVVSFFFFELTMQTPRCAVVLQCSTDGRRHLQCTYHLTNR